MPEHVERFGIRAIIGKAGMDHGSTKRSFVRQVPYFQRRWDTVGYGTATLYGCTVKSVNDVSWEDELGLPEAMWVLNVKNWARSSWAETILAQA